MELSQLELGTNCKESAYNASHVGCLNKDGMLAEAVVPSHKPTPLILPLEVNFMLKFKGKGAKIQSWFIIIILLSSHRRNVCLKPTGDNYFMFHRMNKQQNLLVKKQANSQNRTRFVLPGAPQIIINYN